MLCSNILPGQEAEVSIIPGLKTAQVRLNTVEVSAGSNLLSRTKVNSFMPFRRGKTVLSLFIARIIGINFLVISCNNREISVNNSAINWVSRLAFYLALWEAFNISPV